MPYYVVFSRETDQMRLFILNGGGYNEVIGHGGRIWIPSAGLGLGVWRGVYKGSERAWLRWYDEQEKWIPTDAERADQERQRADQEHHRADQERKRAQQAQRRVEKERKRADQERERAERLAAMLRQLGHDPDQMG